MGTHPSYELFEELGRGQTTVVYRGWDSALSRPIAVKQLQEKFQQDARRKQQFIEQAQFLANLKHENVLNVYSLEPQLGWIVMELMKGSMETKLKEGALPPDLVRSIVRQSLRALVYLHGQDRIHGKVRPSNILIDEQGRVKLSDFETGGSQGEIPVPKGEEKYMAPELLNPDFGPVSRQLDLYCLGFTALELLTGDRFNSLFPGVGKHAADAKMSWIRWHSSEEELKPASELVRRLPGDLAQAIDLMTKKHVSERPETADEVLDLLSDAPDMSIELAPENSVEIPRAPAPAAAAAEKRPVGAQHVPRPAAPAARSQPGLNKRCAAEKQPEKQQPRTSRRSRAKRVFPWQTPRSSIPSPSS
jgi:serine/threonine protein kinase